MRDNASWFVPVSSPLVTMETFIHDPLEITSCFYKPSYLLFQVLQGTFWSDAFSI
ncbi:hypothetical protein POPTR_002G111550v4 [Populus trichocarpa]|uniref:Uncharacterized protein n=1 Tax=Populus trichocarpa TaxID=3694 RepID=A0ACC0TD87_POPTR|nr:hypothetical protein POPTR_002G111550v4 [Populus trichocarpa]